MSYNRSKTNQYPSFYQPLFLCILFGKCLASSLDQYVSFESFLSYAIKYADEHLNFDRLLKAMPLLSSSHIQALISTTAISLFPFFMISLIPKSICYSSSKVMRVLLGFAVGSLIGDTLLHLIPHSLEIIAKKKTHMHHNNEQSNAFFYVSYSLMAGMLVFFLFENIIRIIKWKMYQSSVAAQKKKDSEIKLTPEVSQSSKKNKSKTNQVIKNVSKSVNLDSGASFDQPDTFETCTKKKKSKRHTHSINYISSSTSALLNFVTDFSHNFLDGMAIGAAYYNNSKLGLATTISIFLHEIPHEISDFTILIKCGYTKWKAAFIQLITATGAIMGTYAGLYLSQHEINGQHPYWVLPFTAGGFIYIACVCILPEMLNDCNPKLSKLLLECSGMILGVSLMEILNNIHVH